MPNDLVKIEENSSSELDKNASLNVQRLLKFSKFNKSKSTIKTHFYSLWDFTKYLALTRNKTLSNNKNAEISKALTEFCNYSALEAKLIVADYLSSLQEKKQSTSTMATKLAAIKDHVAFQKGITHFPNWDLDFIKAPKVENKKVDGPTEIEFSVLLKRFLELENSKNYIEKRNALLCLIISFCALRISEALSINIEEIDWKNSKILISRKGKKLKQDFYLGEKILEKIKTFVLFNNRNEGPLFINQDKVNKSYTRLTRNSAFRIIREIGSSVKIDNLHPHKFRHFSITEGLEANKGNVHETKKFSGHVSDKQIARYEDERKKSQLATSKYIENKWL
jgi:integrase/recombinase XerC